MGGVKDSDVVYEAERCIQIQQIPVRVENPQELLDHIWGTRWFQARWPQQARRPICIKLSNHQCGWSEYATRTIWLPPWTRADLTILHEIAHFCSQGDKGQGGHGALFQAAHLELVGRFMGADAQRRYRCALKVFR